MELMSGWATMGSGEGVRSGVCLKQFVALNETGIRGVCAYKDIYWYTTSHTCRVI